MPSEEIVRSGVLQGPLLNKQPSEAVHVVSEDAKAGLGSMPGAKATSSKTISDSGAETLASIAAPVPTILFLRRRPL